mmetsp:Transcript_15897/g.52185  ORF Transcript_15897/g.52185 Transcript_15897/m.52185 type:complete len:267 (-) Transcript_15897:2422-3222(-)
MYTTPKNSTSWGTMKRRPTYCSGSTSARRVCLANTCHAESTPEDCVVRGGRVRFCVASGPAPSAICVDSDEASHPSSTCATCAAEVVSLETKSRTASAGFASLDSGVLILPKYSCIACRVPQYATRPPETTSTLWNPANTSADGWWIVHTTAALRALATRASRVRIAAAAAESRPEVGSSRMITEGCLTSATAKERRRRWPPERPLKRKPPAIVSAHDVKPVSCSKSSTSASLDSTLVKSERYTLNANNRCCRGDMVGHKLSSRGT